MTHRIRQMEWRLQILYGDISASWPHMLKADTDRFVATFRNVATMRALETDPSLDSWRELFLLENTYTVSHRTQ